MMRSLQQTSCAWGVTSQIMQNYHDTEWGVPLYDEHVLFEFLALDAFQAGLSWYIVLRKRDGFRQAFDNFDPDRIANYTRARIELLVKDERIIRNRLKIEATVVNAKAYLELQQRPGGAAGYFWSFVNGRPKQARRRSMKDLPVESKESQQMSKGLKQEGFKFVGPTSCYAFMQAAGMVNDHIITCFRYPQIVRLGEQTRRPPHTVVG